MQVEGKAWWIRSIDFAMEIHRHFKSQAPEGEAVGVDVLSLPDADGSLRTGIAWTRDFRQRPLPTDKI